VTAVSQNEVAFYYVLAISSLLISDAALYARCAHYLIWPVDESYAGVLWLADSSTFRIPLVWMQRWSLIIEYSHFPTSVPCLPMLLINLSIIKTVVPHVSSSILQFEIRAEAAFEYRS
jgi:hypothetical protein